MFYKLQTKLSEEVLKILYFAFVYSHLLNIFIHYEW